jgi:hypothetical protein
MAVLAVPPVPGDHLVHSQTEDEPWPDDRDPLLTRGQLSDQRKIITGIIFYKKILKLKIFYNSANIVVSLPKYPLL